jgi:hypothetical protein
MLAASAVHWQREQKSEHLRLHEALPDREPGSHRGVRATAALAPADCPGLSGSWSRIFKTYRDHGPGPSRFMQVPQRGHVVASIMLRELRLLLVPSRLPWVEGARRLLEELFVGAAESISACSNASRACSSLCPLAR